MPMIEFTEWGQLPAVRLRREDGAQAIVTLFGAHIVSWITADGRERLFCSERSARDGSRAIRGGIPLIFPQFAERGDGIRHGFARISHWHMTQHSKTANACWAEFCLEPTDVPPDVAWQHSFELNWRVILHKQSLELIFDVKNNGTTPFSFASALHGYWQVDELNESVILGLQNLPFSEQISNPLKEVQQISTPLQINEKIDRIYAQPNTPLKLQHGGQQLRFHHEGFGHIVVWNPGMKDAAALNDLNNDEYRRFVCIEPALIKPIVLAVGERWQGWHRINTKTLAAPISD
jgi:glucose-6-phosphate 1-epimerase